MKNNYFKTWLWAGITLAAIFVVARPTLAAEIIVDDGDAEYADTGWSSANNQGYSSDVRYIINGDGSQTATSTPIIPAAGNYHVYVSWTTHANRATNAPYTVNYSGGSQIFLVNQELLNDQVTVGAQTGEWSDWYLLGTFAFDAGTTGNVVLKNNANEYVIADAVRFVSTGLVVDDDGIECPARDFSTIQAAVDAASAGDTIEVCPGTYNEQITINKSLTLNGAQAGVDARGRSAAEAIVSSAGVEGTIIIDPTTGTVTIDGFDLSGTPTPGSGGVVYVSGLTDNVVVKNTIIEPSTADGILFWNAASGTAEQNWIKGASLSGISGGRDADMTSMLTVKNNRIDDAFYGITGYLDSSLISGNQITGTAAGAAGIGGQFYNTTITENQVSGYTAGVGLAFQDYLSRGMDAIDVNNNSFTGNAVGVYVNDDITGKTITVNNNSIAGNPTAGATYGVLGAGILDAENNWWGACDGPSGVGPGSGDAVSANVDFDPWTGCLARVSGMKFDDVNGNGANDGEPGLPGWTITGASEAETFTVNADDTDGVDSSVLDNDQTYLVRVSGTFLAGDSIQADAKYSVRPPNAQWTDSVQNYESYGPALLDLQIDGASPDWGAYNGNHVYWYSLLGTGATLNFKVNDIYYPGNSGSFAVTIYKVMGSGVTGSDGTYSFSFTSYVNQVIVAEETQDGWTQTLPMPLGYYTVDLPGSASDLDFGNYKYGAIEGMKYEDMNNNGVHDEDEPGLEGWTIKLTPLNPVGPVMTYLTNPDGTYSFTDLVPGEYFVEELPQTNWSKSEPAAAGYTVTISTSGQTELLNFGNWRLGALYGMKFRDVNGNGVKDAGELGMGGWTITLNPGGITTVTAPDGTYAFSNLVPGIYELTETMKPGWWQTLPGDTGIQEVFVRSGENLGSVDFGNFQLGKIVGAKYNDRNKNKRYDPTLGEAGLQGWRIQLINLQNGQQQYTTTGAGGLYEFADLKPGRYLVREVLQPKWIPSNPASGVYNSVSISVSGEVQTRDFLNYQITAPTLPVITIPTIRRR